MAAPQHFGMNCMDPIQQEKFYTKHLGFKRVRVFGAGTGHEVPLVRLGGLCLEFFQAAPGTASQGGEQPVGFKHLAFEVDDIEKKVQELQADGIKTDDIWDCSNLVKGMRIVFFRDPEGNIIELMEGYKDDENPPALAD